MEDSLDPAEAQQRSRLATSINQTIFPADKKTLVEDARSNFADDWVVGTLERLPEGTEFENVQRVWEALGGSEEHRF